MCNIESRAAAARPNKAAFQKGPTEVFVKAFPYRKVSTKLILW